MIHRVIPVSNLPHALDFILSILCAILHKELASKVGPGSATQNVPLE